MKKKALPIYLSAILFLVNTFHPDISYAQAKQYRLADFYQLSLQTYPGLDSKKEKIKALTYEKKQVKVLQLPQVNLQLQNTYGTFQGSTGSVFPLPGVFNINPGDVDRSNTNAISTTYGSVVADWTFFSFGKIQKQKLAANKKEQEAKNDLSAYALSLQSKVTNLYLLHLYYQSKYDWALQSANRIEQIVAISKSYAEAGLKPGADTSLAVSAYLKIKSDVQHWKGKLEFNGRQMEEFIQLPFSATEKSMDAFLKSRPTPFQDSVSLQHPYLSVIESRIDYFDAMEKSAARAALPSASILGGLSIRGSGIDDGATTNDWSASFQNPQNNYLVGIGIKWNLTSGFYSKLDRKRIQHQKYAVAADLAQKRLQLNSVISATKAQIQQELQRMDATNESVAKAREAYELFSSRYESGLLGLTELLQIQAILQDSENAQIEAYHELWDVARTQSEYSGDFSNLFSIF